MTSPVFINRIATAAPPHQVHEAFRIFAALQLREERDRQAQDACGIAGCGDYEGLQSRALAGTGLIAVLHRIEQDDDELTVRLRFYNEGGKVRRPGHALHVKPLGLTDAEVKALCDFMDTLASQDAPVTIPVLPR